MSGAGHCTALHTNQSSVLLRARALSRFKYRVEINHTAALEESSSRSFLSFHGFSCVEPVRKENVMLEVDNGEPSATTYFFGARMIGQFQFTDVQWLPTAVRHQHHFITDDDL